MRLDFNLEDSDVEQLRVKECCCGRFHLEGPDFKMHFTGKSLKMFYDRLELLMELLEKRQSPSWLRGVYSSSSKHT